MRRRVVHSSANAEGVDRSPRGNERSDAVLVEAPARDDADLVEPGGVEEPSGLKRVSGEVA